MHIKDLKGLSRSTTARSSSKNVMSVSNHFSLFQAISTKYVVPIVGFESILSLFWVREKRAGKYSSTRETRKTARQLRYERSTNFSAYWYSAKLWRSSCRRRNFYLFVWMFLFDLSMLLFPSILTVEVVPNSSRARALIFFVWWTHSLMTESNWL